MEKKRVFISYSWDSEEHQEWVLYLANCLRAKGLIADADVFETQKTSVHLNRMMVEKVRDSDFIIIVLTENYAKKADNFEGGVGFESQLTLPLIMEDPNKLIPIMLHQGDFAKVFPFHFKGQYAIDFSNDTEFDNKFEELLYRLYGKPRYYVEPVGEAPTLNPRIPSRRIKEGSKDINKVKPSAIDFSDLDLPIPKRITDRDIERFLKDSFNQITEGFTSLFMHIQSINPDFEFDQDNINNYKTIFSLYVNGQNVSGVKMWYGNSFGNNSINLSYGRLISTSDNSMNEMITYDIDEKKKLKLKMTMNISGNKTASTPEEIVKEIWKNNLSPVIY
ncbi:toll/interleukin-1 receptor domain-containing protein [Priestia aryabhattai]|uniref:toll/interleukin-1 receptor domain-containing protein n=1 Tax=Priestia aryabhattai TaxID=412384 RepID=UPI002452C4FD|nr:toll/interleukin-1 receptor domain-containing protein [Priestia aryabhattai]MDH3111460.1 toll/interleukin-1 receptor domain-containing protein [Priestia aryabhattai]MDH3129619.1 toll/interleukin-1 receptor domain-containing protein [Priestia aryabhattai]